jgi:hypothetical protein
MPDNDFEIFENKSFTGLCKDIYDRSENKKDQLDLLISELRPYIRSLDDAREMVPLIQGYLEVSVRNDEQLVKLAQVSQRLQTAKMDRGGGEALLTDAEKEALWQEVKEVIEVVKTPVSIITSSITPK